jgi:hypothetical protein
MALEVRNRELIYNGGLLAQFSLYKYFEDTGIRKTENRCLEELYVRNKVVYLCLIYKISKKIYNNNKTRNDGVMRLVNMSGEVPGLHGLSGHNPYNGIMCSAKCGTQECYLYTTLRNIQ